MDEPVLVGGMAVRLNASVGVRCWRPGEADADRVLSQGNHAVRQAKQRRSGIERYDPERDAAGSRRLALTDSLRRSIARRELVLHYQPKVDLCSGRVVGVEALARWTNEDGPVSPELFIEVAEEGGLIAELTRAMFEQALAQARRWEEEGTPLVVAVNLSPRNLLDPDLASRVRALLTKHGVSPRQLILEITETTLVPDPIRTSAVLEDLRRIGVRLSIDDYGTGHAALAYLRDFPVDELKLDRSYVAGMIHDPRTAAIVRSTVEMGRQLGLTVVAEGVERQEELEAVKACGCHVVQGYLMCRPLPGDQLSAWLQRRFAAARDCA
jgi:EAL domain-containing protein (putative c-di-GMP-specific phosphodiesterase class I)